MYMLNSSTEFTTRSLRWILFMTLHLSLIALLQGQDTLADQHLSTILIQERKSLGGMEHQSQIKEEIIYLGKKNEIIRPDKTGADLSSNNMRQIYAKVPGIFIWESEGSGIQTNLATRGLSPNRNWEFNVRQNGADICGDVFGYPEAYYTPPAEAIGRVEFIRGAAALQFGPQFGGLLNYKIKEAQEGRPFQFESQQTIGSFGLFNSYNALGGHQGKWKWYAFYHQRKADGWRNNNTYDTYTTYGNVSYAWNAKWSAQIDYTRMNYTSQQPGGLTDAEFLKDPRQSFRSRNWMSTPWNTGSLTLHFNSPKNFSLQWKNFFTHSVRQSVGFLRTINIPDTLIASSLSYHNRQIDVDRYKNLGSEIRSVWTYDLGKREQQLVCGVRAYTGSTERNQLGKGSIGQDPDFSAEPGSFGRALDLGTLNFAFFAEQLFRINKRWSISPGFRLEYLNNTIEGTINAQHDKVDDTRLRKFILLGLSSQFQVSPSTHMYANVANSYRPVTFSELTPSAVSDIIDPELHDSKGFQIDLGYRGRLKDYLSFDLGTYFMDYQDRIGTLLQNNQNYRTNIGASRSFGIESYLEWDIYRFFVQDHSTSQSIRIFSSNAWNHARYSSWNNPDIAKDPLKSIKGKRVEYAPEFIHRIGFQLDWNGWNFNLQYSHVGSVYTDAANTQNANTAASSGFLPAYEIWDASAACQFLEHYTLRCGVNNLWNETYATRRSGGYPGSGLLPGQGRNFYLGIGVHF